MTKFSTSTGEWIAVNELPDGAFKINISNGCLLWFKTPECTSTWSYQSLPAGHTYTIIGRADTLTNEQWAGIVDKAHINDKYWASYYSSGTSVGSALRNS